MTVRYGHGSRTHTLPLTLDSLRSFGQSLHLEPVCCLEEGGQLLLAHVYLTCIHELEDSLQVAVSHVFQNDDWVLGGVLL